MTNAPALLKAMFDVKEFFTENVSYVLMLVGAILLLAGVSTVSLMERPVFSLIEIFFGISLPIIGLLTKIQLVTFRGNLGSNLGSILLLTSCFCLAGAVISFIDMEVWKMWVPGLGAANPLHHNVHFEQTYPLLVFLPTLISAAIISGLSGLILRLRNY